MTDTSETSENTMTFRDYVRVLFRQKAVVLTSFFVIMGTVILGLTYMTPEYEGSVRMLISGEKDVDSPYYKQLIMGMQDIEPTETQGEIVTSVPVLRRVVDALRLYNKPIDYERQFASPLKKKIIGLQTRMYKAQLEHMPKIQQFSYNYQQAVEQLRSSTKVEPVKETNMFIIHVTDYDPVGAAVLANVVSRSYVMFDMEQQLAELQQKYGDKQPTVIQLQDGIKHMATLLDGRPMTNQEALGSASVKIIEQASIPFKPVGHRNLIAFAALFASIFMAIMLAFIFEYMDQSIKSPNDVERILGIPLFGTVPFLKSIKKMLVLKNIEKMPKRYNAAFQNLANQLRLMMAVKPFKTVLVTTAGKHEGTSTIVANLGLHSAQGGAKKVLIIDANFHSPSMHKIFNIPEGPGFVDVLTQQTSIEQAIKSVQPSLSVLPAGKTTVNPVIFLDSPKTREILEKLKSQFDLILIDCVDLNTAQEGCLLAPWVDKTIIVISENQTRRPVALKVLSDLNEHKASILGAILNKRTYPIPKFIYERV